MKHPARAVSLWSKKLRRSLGQVSDRERAKTMQAYMKSAMPYYGVPSPALRTVAKAVFAEYPFHSAAEWQSDLLEIWRSAEGREERYAAIELTGDRRAKSFQTIDAVPMYEEMIVSGAWWDFVDVLASRRIGPILAHNKAPMTRLMSKWSRDRDMWKRRTAIICQLGFKAETDLDLLYRCIEPALGEKEFFLRKAIGWALRQYAWTDPDEVRRYVHEHRDRLSPLSMREALKNLT